MRNERARLQQFWKSCANGSNIVPLRFGDHGTKEMLGVVGWKVWPVSNNNIQQHMQQGVQTDATCNIQQCCARLHGAWRYSQDFPWKWQVHSFVSNNEISPQSIMHIKRSKQQQTKKTNFEKLCWKTTIIVRFNVHPCLFCQRFAVFSYLILVFRSFFFMFYSLWWRLSLSFVPKLL